MANQSLTVEQFYSEKGQQLLSLEYKLELMKKRQGYFSIGQARLGDRIEKLREKILTQSFKSQ